MQGTDGGVTGYNTSTEDRPLGAYSVLIALFNGIFVAFLLAARRTGRDLPPRVQPADLALLGVATHKLSRLLAKDSVTSTLRAPFTTYGGPAGEGEVEDKPRGRGMQHALGELITCPFCLGQWVASFFAYGLVFAPRVTRFAAGIFAMLTVADVLQLGYDVTKHVAERSERQA